MRVLFDCDPGLDDGVALLAALVSARFDVLAITTVAGNVQGPQTALNARIVRTLAGRETVPVHAGAPRPLLRDQVTAEDFHGTSGLGGLDLPEPGGRLSRTHGVNALIRQARAARGDPVSLVITGPMTNVALALTMAPDMMQGIREIVLMGGGSRDAGNITPFAEFNVFADPHAAAIVFGCGLPVRCLSLDVTHGIRTTPARLAQVRDVGTEAAKYAADFLEASCQLEMKANGDESAPLHDPSTVIALARPDLFEGRQAHVQVVTEEGERFGHTQVTFAQNGPVLWYERADADGVYETLCVMLGGA